MSSFSEYWQSRGQHLANRPLEEFAAIVWRDAQRAKDETEIEDDPTEVEEDDGQD